MLNAIVHSLSAPVSSHDEENRQDENDNEADSELGNLCKDNEPDWVIGTITNMVQQCMKCVQNIQIRLDELMQPRWEDKHDYFHKGGNVYGTAELRVLAVAKLQTYHGVAVHIPTTLGELRDTLAILPRTLQILQGTSQPDSRHIRLRSRKP